MTKLVEKEWIERYREYGYKLTETGLNRAIDVMMNWKKGVDPQTDEERVLGSMLANDLISNDKEGHADPETSREARSFLRRMNNI